MTGRVVQFYNPAVETVPDELLAGRPPMATSPRQRGLGRPWNDRLFLSGVKRLSL